ncbi:uncharacterized protein LOC142767471 isoform X1 [Rhipicephalus microplus]|uniref:uncharacterized protein LOC142767471 isoform X1 n=1 Tax=Rhipicephalus microplus TaxID=6941 RepID=UPI003F6A9B93
MASESSACETSAHSAIECVKDNESSSPDVDVLRANITDERHACSWVEDYGLKTNTSWVVDFVKPTAKCERMVFHKVWRCKEAKREKSCGEAAAHCPAKIDLQIKKVNRNTKRNDAFLRGEKPLPAVIKLFHHKNHSHSTAAADALSRLTPTMQTRETFLAYFDSGMSPAEATRLHESKLLVQEDGYALVANSAVNPLPPAIYYRHRLCREKNFGKDVDPLLKIAEMPLYAKHGELTITALHLHHTFHTCYSCLVVMVLDCQPKGRRIESWLGQLHFNGAKMLETCLLRFRCV